MASTELVLLQGEPYTEAEMEVFESQHMAVFKGMSDLKKKMKKLKDEEDKLKAQLEKVMDECGIKSLNNEFVRITRIEENPGKQTIDVDKMQKEEPKLYEELLADYPKTTGKKKAYVKIEAK